MIVTVGASEVPAGTPLAVRVSDTLTLTVCELDGVHFQPENRALRPKHLELRSFPVTREGDQLSIDLKDATEPAATDTAPPGTPSPAG